MAAIPQKRPEKRMQGTTPPIVCEAIFPLQLRPGQPFELVQVILGPLQGLCGLAPSVGVSGLGSTKLLPNLADALPAETHFVSQLTILLRPVHLGPPLKPSTHVLDYPQDRYFQPVLTGPTQACSIGDVHPTKAFRKLLPGGYSPVLRVK